MVCGQGSSGTGDREEVMGTQARQCTSSPTVTGVLGAMFPASEPERNKNGLTREGNLWPSGGDRHVNRELQTSPGTAVMEV